MNCNLCYNYFSLRITTFLVMFFFAFNCFGQKITQQTIEKLGIDQGLSNNEIRCIFQDHIGFMWFGTYDGLNRYDGYSFKVYRNNPNSNNSLVNNWVNCLTEDDEDNLWIGTRQGISVLNPLNDDVSSVYAHQINSSSIIKITTEIKDIHSVNGRVFAASQDLGLIRFSKSIQQPGIIIPLKIGKNLISHYSVDRFVKASDDNLYVLVAGYGLFKYDKDNNTLMFLTGEQQVATCLASDGNYLWLGNGFGVHRFDIYKRKFDYNLVGGPSGLSYNRVTCITLLAGKVWIGTDGGGLNILDQHSGKISAITNGADRFSLSSNAIYSLYVDRANRKWIGTLRGGINIIDPVKDRFKNITHNEFDKNSLINDFVKSICEDSDGDLWVGTDGGGLSIWNRASNKFENFRQGTIANGELCSNFITNIIEDSKRNIWISTFDAGINRYDRLRHNFKNYVGFNQQGEPIGHVIWTLFEDHLGQVWASGLHDGTYRYNPNHDRFEMISASLKNVLCFAEDHNGNLWAGAFDGLHLIKEDGLSTIFWVGKPIRSIHLSAKGGLWLGTEAGLMYFDIKKRVITDRFTTDDGLSNNSILAIENDSVGHLWLATYSGLCKFDPGTKRFTNYFQSDGLLNREYNYNASAHLNSGELAFGGTKGLTLFFPHQITPFNDNPKVVVTDLSINNLPANRQQKYLKSSNGKLQSITIPFSEASLNIKFAAVEFASQDRIDYRFRMEGWDHNWNFSKKNREAIYTRLDPGKYKFVVSCTNAEGKWGTQNAAFEVIVLPPWYLSWWAYLIYFIIVLLAGYWYITYKLRESKLRFQIQLAQTQADHQRAIQDKERELNEKRLELFTWISHEFRAPIALIVNPVEDLIRKGVGNGAQELKIVLRSAKRLLSLVDQLLLFRKTETANTTMSVAQVSLSEVCRQVLDYFEQIAKFYGISLEYIEEAACPLVYVDLERLEVILFNLISNAIKFSGDGGTVKVVLNGDALNAYIQVIDSGPGIPEEIGDKIFEKFYRSSQTHSVPKSGFGMGLFIAKQFANDHKANLTYQSDKGGTIFTLSLKFGCEHFGKEVAVLAASPTSNLLNELSVVSGAGDEKNGTDFSQPLFSDKKAVLVIDDDAELRNYIHSVLSYQYIVYQAENGEQGLSMAHKRKPDLIICDVMMPGKNGIEVCENIKSDPEINYIPLILLSASSSAQNKLEGLKSGADDYISKPFDNELLLARIANLLLSRSNLRNYFFDTVTLKSNDISISVDYKEFLEKCIKVVEDHLTDSDFGVKMLGDKLGMSHSNLYRKVKAFSGLSVNGFVRFIKLRKAAELIINSDLNVNEVALETGFNDIKYFRTQFSKLFQMSPSEFMKTKRPVFKKKFNRS